MSGFWPIFKRELFAYFVTPLAYVLLVAFTFWQGLHFFLLIRSFVNAPDFSIDQGPVQAFFGGDVFYYLPLILVCPAITMRLFAEERQRGTIETLMTAPIDATGLVAGKFLAALVCYLFLWSPTLILMQILARAADVDWHVIAVGYLGVTLLGASYLAIGTFFSALARSQLVALVVTSVFLLGLFLLGLGEYVLDDGIARAVCAHVSVWAQMGEFGRGIIDSRRLVFDGVLIALPLILCTKIVASWREQ